MRKQEDLYYGDDEVVNIAITPNEYAPLMRTSNMNDVIVTPKNDKVNIFITGEGKDTLVVQKVEHNAKSHMDIVQDFDLQQDVIDLSYYGNISFKDLNITSVTVPDVGNFAVVFLPNGQSVALKDVNPSQVTADLFKFKGIGEDQFFNFKLGTSGNDTLTGDDHQNYLISNGGNDVMTGGKGYDIFVFDETVGVKTVTDFNVHEDVIHFPGYMSSLTDFSDLNISYNATNNSTTLSIGNSSMVLQNVDPNSLTEGNFSLITGHMDDMNWL